MGGPTAPPNHQVCAGIGQCNHTTLIRFASCLSSLPWKSWGRSGVISAASTVTHGASALRSLIPGLAWPSTTEALALRLALGHDGRPRDCLPGAHGSRRLHGQMQLRGRNGGLAISWRMRRRQPGRGEGAVSGNPSPKKANENKGKEPIIHSFNKSSIGQLPPGRPHGTGAGHMDTELNAMTGPCPPGVHVLC